VAKGGNAALGEILIEIWEVHVTATVNATPCAWYLVTDVSEEHVYYIWRYCVLWPEYWKHRHLRDVRIYQTTGRQLRLQLFLNSFDQHVSKYKPLDLSVHLYANNKDERATKPHRTSANIHFHAGSICMIKFDIHPEDGNRMTQRNVCITQTT